MAMSTNLHNLSKIAEVIGFSEAITLSAFIANGNRIYVPVTANEGHVIAKVIGISAHEKLVQEYAGQYIEIPRLDVGAVRDAGNIYRLTKKGLSPADIAAILGLSRKTIQTVKKSLALEGLAALADDLPDDEADNV